MGVRRAKHRGEVLELLDRRISGSDVMFMLGGMAGQPYRWLGIIWAGDLSWVRGFNLAPTRVPCPCHFGDPGISPGICCFGFALEAGLVFNLGREEHRVILVRVPPTYLPPPTHTHTRCTLDSFSAGFRRHQSKALHGESKVLRNSPGALRAPDCFISI